MATRTQTVKRTTTTDDREVAPTTTDITVILARVIWFIASVILILLAFRFLFSLLGANRSNSIADFVYSTSHPFVAPFFGLFHYNVIDYGVSRFEVYTVVAMLVYAAIAAILVYLVT
ncbi:MAG TPA: hypothetical protein VGE97_03865, partial [Nitrososphaera sp.]